MPNDFFHYHQNISKNISEHAAFPLFIFSLHRIADFHFLKKMKLHVDETPCLI